MRKKILFVVPLPPPTHGSAVMSQIIKDSNPINDTYICDYINLSLSRDLDKIGKLGILKIWRFLSSLCKELWLLISHEYDLCYCAITCHGIGFLKDAPFVLLCKLFGKKTIIHQHNKGMTRDVDRWPYRWLLPFCYKDAKVVLLSLRLYGDIERIVAKKNVLICPNGIPEVDYEYKERQNEVPHILFLSNLIESKGVIVLLDAMRILKDKGYSLVCDFVGGETKEIDRNRLTEEISNKSLTGLVKYHGKMYGQDKEKFLIRDDIFVFPTYYPNECFPLVLLEAMQYGLPIVTTDEGGILDMVKDGDNGFICEKNNPVLLADCIEKLLVDRELRTQMGKYGMDLYRRYYTSDIFENHLLQILNSTIC